jgi:pyrroloquinoline quinone (PQQ) biosynthesis protein C
MIQQLPIEALKKSFYNFPWEEKLAYAEYLAQSYYYIDHSCRLLALAASQTSNDEKPVFKRMADHLREEMNHERLCTHDLKILGFTLENFPELPSTQALYEQQYFHIQKYGATSFLGYVYTLETIACLTGPRILQDKLAKTYPASACTFLKVHAEEDPEHITKARELILSLTPNQVEKINRNIEITCSMFTHFLGAIEDKYRCEEAGIPFSEIAI